MVLAVHSNAGHNKISKARSGVGGHCFMLKNEDIRPPNGSILNISKIIKAVMSSAAEAEEGTLSINTKEVVYIRNI